MDTAQLRDLQALPLKYKIMISQERIKEWYEHWEGKVYVSFSGGKDSTVLLHLVRQLYPDVPAVFVDTGLEYPEIRQFVKRNDNVIPLRPKMTFKQVLEKYGYPVISKEQSQFLFEIRTGRSEKLRNIRLNGNKSGHGKVSEQWKYLINAPFAISHKCCEVMKKKPFAQYEKESGRKPIMGIMADESDMRGTDYMANGGCNFFETKRVKSWPLGFWTEQDILQSLLDNDLSYASVYGNICKRGGQLVTTGVQRTGCMFCMFGCHLDPEPNRFQRMQVTHPKHWKYCMFGTRYYPHGPGKVPRWGPSSEGLGLSEVLNYIGIPWNDSGQLWTTEEILKGGNQFDH